MATVSRVASIHSRRPENQMSPTLTVAPALWYQWAQALVRQGERNRGPVAFGPRFLSPCLHEIADERFDFRGLEWFDDGANVGAPVFESEFQRIAGRNDDG
jgi:hypothetical protein